METIKEFQDEYRWLSNFAPVKVEYGGMVFPSTENAYQAMKGISLAHAFKCTSCDPSVSKKLGKICELRPNFDEIKLQLMYNLNLRKYLNEKYKQLLLDTGDMNIVEGNYWHDNFWGDCYCPRCKNFKGENNLGIIIMKIRDIIRRA